MEYADILEGVACQRAAAAFASNDKTALDIYVNVQPLSGGPANNAVYHGLVDLGDTVMGMNLLHGGHLSHGSRVNRSGEFYNIVSYSVNPETEKIEWLYKSSPPDNFFSITRGSNERLPNGNTLITESDKGRVFEVTKEGEVVWEFYSPDTNVKNKKRGAIFRMSYITDRGIYEMAGEQVPRL